MIGLMMVILIAFHTYGELVLRGVGPILGNGQKQPPEVFYLFHVDFAKFLRKPFFQNISGRLLLNGYGIYGQLLQESEMLAKLQSSNLQSRKYQSKISSFCF